MNPGPSRNRIIFLKHLQTQMNSKIFSDLLEFIKSAHKMSSLGSEGSAVIHEIPTAALITGKCNKLLDFFTL